MRALNGSHQRQAAGTGGVGIDTMTRELAMQCGWPVARLPAGQVLCAPAQDFIKALIAYRCLDGRTSGSTQILAKAAKRLFSITATPPWAITREHFEALLALKAWSDKAKRDFSVVARIIDEHLLSTGCPVQPHIEIAETRALLPNLSARGMATTSHVGRSFKRIQTEHGDEAAFTWLAASSDGFHVTPYGFCTNSFSVNPCAASKMF
nr:hypothetical protein [Paraburkholderia sp. BL8N3]